MKTCLKFFKTEAHLLRNTRLLGRRRRKSCSYFSYNVKCCQMLSAALQTKPPQQNIILKIKILGYQGVSRRCQYHSHTDIVVYDRPEQESERKQFLRLQLNGETGFSLFTVALHKPYYCVCRTVIRFSARRDDGTIHKLTRGFNIKS